MQLNLGGLIPLIGGVYATLVGFRVIRVSRKNSEELEQWYQRYGILFKIGGPLIVLLGLLELFCILPGGNFFRWIVEI